MYPKNSLRSDINKLVKEISKINDVQAIYLFGSYTTKRMRNDSDIDIAVIVKSPNRNKELKIMGYGNELFDVSIFNRLPLIIQFRVIKEGKLIYCKDKIYLNEIKKSILKKYLDYSQFINRFYRRIIKNV